MDLRHGSLESGDAAFAIEASVRGSTDALAICSDLRLGKRIAASQGLVLALLRCLETVACLLLHVANHLGALSVLCGALQRVAPAISRHVRLPEVEL